MGPDAMILVFWMLIFNPTFSLYSFTFISRLFNSSSLSAIRVVSTAYLRLLIYLLAILKNGFWRIKSTALTTTMSPMKTNQILWDFFFPYQYNSCDSQVSQWWRIFLQCRRHRFDPWIGKISWNRKWQPIPVFLPGKFYGQRILVNCSPWVTKNQSWLSMHEDTLTYT